MIKVNDMEFKAKVYAPFMETWKTLQIIQYGDHSMDTDDIWRRYADRTDRLKKAYEGNSFAEACVKFLYDVGDHIADMNS